MLPTLNEAENLGGVVARLREVAPAAQVLVVDDDSTDGTQQVADDLARGDPAVRVLHRRGKKGYGESLTEGFRAALEAGATVVASMDCDFSHDPSSLPVAPVRDRRSGRRHRIALRARRGDPQLGPLPDDA